MPIGSGSAGIGREGGRTCAELVTSLLQRLGQKTDDADNRALAEEALRSAVHRFNLERDWVDRLLTTQITFVASTATYSLPARFRRTVGRLWLVDSSSNRSLDVELLTYFQWLRRVTDEQTSDSEPQVAYVTNRIDTGLITFWPAPSSSTVTNYPEAELVYFADIPVCGGSTDTLAVSGALEQAIFDEALYVLNDMRGDAEKAGRYLLMARDSMRLARAYDNQMRLNMGILRGLS